MSLSGPATQKPEPPGGAVGWQWDKGWPWTHKPVVVVPMVMSVIIVIMVIMVAVVIMMVMVVVVIMIVSGRPSIAESIGIIVRHNCFSLRLYAIVQSICYFTVYEMDLPYVTSSIPAKQCFFE